MSDTYTGWDGKPYPWPPPEGWYHASDGRWWAPDTGPNPPPQAMQPTALAPPAGSAPSEAIGQAVSHTAQLPSFGAEGAQSADQSATLFSTDATAALPPQSDYNPGPQLGQAQAQGLGETVPAGPPGGPPNYDNTAGSAVGFVARRPSKGGGGIGQALLIVGGIVAAVLVGGFAYLFVTADDGGETATGNGEDTTTVDTATETTDGTGAAETTSDADSDADSDTTPDSDTADTTEADDEASTDDETTSSTEEVTTTAEVASLVAEFRAILDDNDLTSDSLSDSQIQTFAEDFCGLAESAEDSTAFDDVREGAIATTDSGLSPGELRTVINAAVTTFCPAEADRLGVDV